MEKIRENYDKFGEGLKEYQKRSKKYTYRDNSAGGKIVFECTTTDILEADKLYQKEIGKNPEKQSFIGCSMEELAGEKKEDIIIHKRLLTNKNETLCKSAGAKIYLSSRVTCSDCQKIMEQNRG